MCFELLISNLRQATPRSAMEVQRDDLDPYVKLTLLIQQGIYRQRINGVEDASETI